ncbi:hypothetical protein [Lentzea flava]|uniref:Uncharacterized protein n=1 Tax=Lentzea flava TaxID=103732 RepID=A0ABQ2U9C2_9PSEU|nr:hypothetical protein [Lentzea flava]MCP2196971.1 hypothetical protein [Lentzea flava]GGU14180.1 hypothetical protein GCM10010178_01940 [Lentzea flava]
MESVVLLIDAAGPRSRHRRDETRPGCLRGLLAVPGLLVRRLGAAVRRAAAHLCHHVALVC